MIGICTDSNSQLPVELAERHGIEIVPLIVDVDGVRHLEGVDIDADGFYALFEGGRTPAVATAAPPPGSFTVAYERLAAAGAAEIVSVHAGSEISGTFNAARVGAEASAVPVHLVDTHSASFAIALAVLAAAEVVAGGGDAAAAASAAERVAADCSNVFVVGTLQLARAGGRLDPAVVATEGIPVLQLQSGAMRQVGMAGSPEEAAAAMAAEILNVDGRLRVGVAVADASSVPVADALRQRLMADHADMEILEYRVGPSVGVHTGPGTAGAVYHRR